MVENKGCARSGRRRKEVLVEDATARNCEVGHCVFGEVSRLDTWIGVF